MEKILFDHVTVGMAIAFAMGMLCLFLYAWKTKQETKTGYNTNRYMKLTLPNILFHIVSSMLVLMLLHEISEILITNYFPMLATSTIYHNTLSALTGAFGSVLVAKVFEYVRKKQNTIDPNIKHVHDENCEH